MTEQNAMATPDDQSNTPPKRAATHAATVITGDRVCTKCSYNLTGQSVMREPEYGLLIVRCPECSQVASVTEYPMLGRWANRWAAIAAAFYLLLVLLLLGATIGPTVGMCYGAGEIAGEGMGSFINDEVNDWTMAVQAANSTQVGPPAPPAAGGLAPIPPGAATITFNGQVFNVGGGTNASFQQWWQLQTRADLLARAGGWWNVIEKQAIYMWIPLGVLGLMAGCMWAIIALSRGVVGRMLIALFISIITLGFCLIPILQWTTTDPWYSWGAGAYVVGPRMVIYSWLWTTVWLVVGMFAGRPLVRSMVRLFLPPRLRSSLAILWTTDGKSPPRTI